MPTLWAHTAEYTSISVGDDLPILVKFEFRPPIEDGVDAPQEIPVDTEKLAALVIWFYLCGNKKGPLKRPSDKNGMFRKLVG